MDPLTATTILLGLFTNGLYSLILSTGNKVGNLAFREEDIHKRLMRNEANFALVVEEAFLDLPPVIETEEFYEFLDSDEAAEIVKRIFSFDISEYKNLDNLEKTEDYFCENPDSFEKVKEDFCKQLVLYFDKKKEISTIAPQLFFILVECCLESLDVMIKEEQDLSALDNKIKFYFKTSAEKLAKYQERLLKEIKTNQKLITQVLNNTEKIVNELVSLPLKLEPKCKTRDYLSLHSINMAPDLEAGFIQRDSEYNKLVEYLLNNHSDTTVAITTALRGAGGFGKSTLAKAVCHDPKIEERFSDGILWVTLGETPKNLIGHVQDLIYRLSDKRPDFEGLDAAVSYFRDLLHEKSILLVIDDVWDNSHLEPFMQGGSGCVRLITTRINEVLPEGTVEVPVDTMKNEEAVQLLRLGLSCNDDMALDELAKRLGYWPLLLKMVNSALKKHVERGKSFEEALNHVKHKLDRKKLTAFDPNKVHKRNQAVEATISVTFDLLAEAELERYKELAIFPEDEEIHLKTIEKLWGKTAYYDCFDVEDLCYKLFNLSLLQTYDEEKGIIKLHDVMRDYLNHKQQNKIQFIHSQFLAASEVKTWADLPEEDTYMWRHLAHHLVGAERKSELRKLLLDFNWQQSKLNATDVHLLLNDYDLFPEEYPVEMMKGAIRLSANVLSMDKALLAGQLLGRLQSFSDVEIQLMIGEIYRQSGERLLPLTCSLMPPGGPLIRTLTGHTNRVNMVSITPDGKYAVSTSSDRTLKVWDLKTGKEVHTLTGHSNRVRAISITPDGMYAVSTSEDLTLKIWNLKTGKEVHTLTGHTNRVNMVSITPDGMYAVSASSDWTLKIWNLKTGKEVHTLTGHSDLVNAVSITPDGMYAVSASSDWTLKTWNLKTGKEVHTLTGHSDWVNAVSITPDGMHAVSASDDRRLKIWDLKTGKEVHTLTGHSNRVRAISITPDGKYAVSASEDRTLKVWDLKTGKEVHTLTGHSNRVRAISITPDGKYAVSASDDRTLKVWDLKTGKEAHTLTGHSSLIRAVSITPDGKYAVSTSSDRTLKIWDLKTEREIHTLTGHSNRVRAISITPDGKYAVSASDDRTLKIWDLKTGKEIHTLTGHSDRVRAVSITFDGKYAVSASGDRTLKVWDLKTGKEVHTLIGHSNRVNLVYITADGKYAVSASEDRTLKVWDLKTGKEVYTLIGHSNKVNAVSITPDGKYAVSASDDRTLKVWNLKTGKEVHTLTGHSNKVNAVSITPDGRYAVSASDDRTLKVWDLKTGKEVYTLTGHSNKVNAVSITPDGRYAVSASSDRTLKVWDLKTGKEEHTLTGHSDSINAVSVTSDGNYAVSASGDRTLKVWDLKTGKKIAAFGCDSPSVSVMFSFDGTSIVAGEQSEKVHFLQFRRDNL